ncbi:hypothetical protein EVAR_38167_1 [Eumeta japonica]|uniref:Uncharacterized protein n=1 Tax=Eumeta variegata TaxID=151549 RepID=A0A4C1WG93_EUMVA|nr:hypothetical protein EVAR_38167_1 [Eumeta japonica]
MPPVSWVEVGYLVDSDGDGGRVGQLAPPLGEHVKLLIPDVVIALRTMVVDISQPALDQRGGLKKDVEQKDVVSRKLLASALEEAVKL